MAAVAPGDAYDELGADTVGERLRADETRTDTLQALEALPPPIAQELALGAAPVLVDVAAGTEDREVLDRCGLLLARLLARPPARLLARLATRLTRAAASC